MSLLQRTLSYFRNRDFVNKATAAKEANTLLKSNNGSSLEEYRLPPPSARTLPTQPRAAITLFSQGWLYLVCLFDFFFS
jgi:hypothetical protein